MLYEWTNPCALLPHMFIHRALLVILVPMAPLEIEESVGERVPLAHLGHKD